MSMKEDIKEVQDELNDLKQNTWFMDISHDYKKANKRLFIIWIITFIAFITLLGYTIYLLNDIGTEETTTSEKYEIDQDTDSNGNNNFIKGSHNEVK